MHTAATTPASAMVVYVPVHYDFSQVEFVAPFLMQYPESKVFVYSWHRMRDRMLRYYRDEPEYRAARVAVHSFSLKNIVRCILAEPPGRAVVFLLTASTAYGFGSAQRVLFAALKLNNSLVQERVWGVSVIGHCLYGCMSCKGNDHRVPVLFTRFFKNCIPYTAESISRSFSLPAAGSSTCKTKSVLCAPSYGSTSILQERPILEHLKKLQDMGKFTFVWKFHPAVYNEANYESNTPVERTERDNLDWIIANFRITEEEQPCLLPFLQAFDIILCDLHSSVPFIASYFCPKSIICYWNDADYEVPAARDPAFLANLSVFQTLEELHSLFDASTGAHAPAKGDPSFFFSMYGAVDGNEVERFAKLAAWPTTLGAQNAAQGLLRVEIAACAAIWESIYLDIKSGKIPRVNEDEDPLEDYANAMGLAKDVSLEDNCCLLSSQSYNERQSFPTTTLGTLRVATQNLWVGSEGCFKRHVFAGATTASARDGSVPTETLLSYTAQYFVDLDADVICCQETASLPRNIPIPINCNSDIVNVMDSRVDCLPRLAQLMNEKSPESVTWTAIVQGNLTPGPTCVSPWGILTRLKVIRKSPGGYGVLLHKDSPEYDFWVFNVHLPYKPYEPYQISDPQICYEDTPALKCPAEAISSAKGSRGRETQLLMADILAASQTSGSECDTDIVLCGDFNEPSCLDWTRKAVIAGYHPCIVAWPVSNTFQASGFRDCVRELSSDATLSPSFTWCCYRSEFENGQGAPEGWFAPTDMGYAPLDKSERIDYVMLKPRATGDFSLRAAKALIYGNAKCIQTEADMVDEQSTHVPVSNDRWTSDHRGVLVEFNILGKETATS